MGRVWLARDEVLRRDVAIKEVNLPIDLPPSEREELRVRTLREARTAARLSDPSVIQIYDVLRVDDRPWIVMEYIRSRSLQQIIATEGPVSPQRAAQIGLAVLGALVAAHSAGVLHRDVKPGNVLIAADGRVVLTDFGLATFEGGESAVTRPGLVWGSPEYVAPERAKHGTSSVESDMWSLGATLYAAVEGSSPFARTTAMATLTALAVEKPPAPLHAGPLKPVLTGLLRKDPRARLRPGEVERLLQRVVEPDGRPRRLLPRQRTASSTDAAESTPAEAESSDGLTEEATHVISKRTLAALSRAGAKSQRTGAKFPRSAAKSPRTAANPRLAGARPLRPRLGRRGWFVAIAVVILVAVIAAVALYQSGRGRQEQPPPPHASSAGPVAAAPAIRATTVPSSSPLPGEQANPSGWAYYREPGQFRTTVPIGWRIERGNSLTRFREAEGPRQLAIEVSLPPAGGALNAARDLDRLWTLGNGPDGYQRIRLDPVTIGEGGGAEWEYAFKDPTYGRMRVITRWFIAGGRGFQISWTTAEWDVANRMPFNLAIGGFQPL
jgi:serine/threonine protein kinase